MDTEDGHKKNQSWDEDEGFTLHASRWEIDDYLGAGLICPISPSPLVGEGWDGGMVNFRARELRRNLTEAEKTLWRNIRLRQIGGYKFRRQQPIDRYIADFVCFEKRLIIEVDGGQHLEQKSYDSERDKWLEKEGFRILRFWDNQILKEIEAVKQVIMEALI